MAFVNEWMTEETAEAFKERKVPAPSYPSDILESVRWTIDYKRNMFLVWGTQPRDFRGQTYFVFGWKDKYITMLLKETWLNNMTCQWSIVKLEFPKTISEYRQEITNYIKEALTVYGFDGDSTDPNNNLYTIEFNF